VVEQPHQGVTRAWNAGAAQVRTSFVVFLNNDVLTSGPWVDALLAPLRRGSRKLSGVAWRDERALPPEFAAALPMTRFVTGWCCAIPVAGFQEIGGFDESFRLYFSDTDLQTRLMIAFGRECLTVVDEVRDALRHRGHASTRQLPQRRAIWTADRDRFIAKWKPRG
jgi:GT2 family glycosyltransferase